MSGTKITNRDSKTILQVIEAAKFFKPTPDQRETKAMFWVAWNDGPVRSSDKISAVAVVDLTGVAAVEKWWSEEGFREWFLNPRSFDQKAEYLAHIAQDIIAEVMMTADKASDRLKAAEMAIKIAGKEKKQVQEVQFKELPNDEKALQRLVDQTTKQVVDAATEAAYETDSD